MNYTLPQYLTLGTLIIVFGILLNLQGEKTKNKRIKICSIVLLVIGGLVTITTILLPIIIFLWALFMFR